MTENFDDNTTNGEQLTPEQLEVLRKESIVEDLTTAFAEFLVDAMKETKGNKSAGVRARIKSLEFREQLKDWRKDTLT